MGPGRSDPRNKSSSVMDRPVFDARSDLLGWRKKVGEWVRLVKTAHDSGSDRTYKTLFKIIGPTLYQCLPREQQPIVDETHNKQKIDYTQSNDPVEAVLDILKTVAVDPSIAK